MDILWQENSRDRHWCLMNILHTFLSALYTILSTIPLWLCIRYSCISSTSWVDHDEWWLQSTTSLLQLSTTYPFCDPHRHFTPSFLTFTSSPVCLLVRRSSLDKQSCFSVSGALSILPAPHKLMRHLSILPSWVDTWSFHISQQICAWGVLEYGRWKFNWHLLKKAGGLESLHGVYFGHFCIYL